MPDPRGYTVFEIAHDTRREIYVSATRDPLHRLSEELSRRRPAPIRGWDLADARPVRSIEFDMSEEGARAFIERYVQTPLPEGWRYLKSDSGHLEL